MTIRNPCCEINLSRIDLLICDDFQRPDILVRAQRLQEDRLIHNTFRSERGLDGMRLTDEQVIACFTDVVISKIEPGGFDDGSINRIVIILESGRTIAISGYPILTHVISSTGFTWRIPRGEQLLNNPLLADTPIEKLKLSFYSFGLSHTSDYEFYLKDGSTVIFRWEYQGTSPRFSYPYLVDHRFYDD